MEIDSDSVPRISHTKFKVPRVHCIIMEEEEKRREEKRRGEKRRGEKRRGQKKRGNSSVAINNKRKAGSRKKCSKRER